MLRVLILVPVFNLFIEPEECFALTMLIMSDNVDNGQTKHILGELAKSSNLNMKML